MKTKLFTLFFVIVASIETISADAVKIGALYYNLDTQNKTAEVTHDNYSSMTAVIIPDSVEYNALTYTVTSIGEYAFFGCAGLTSLVLPAGVTTIGSYAFYSCTGLTSVTIGNSVDSIGEGAFYNCIGLTSLDIPNSVTSIGDFAFSGVPNIVYYGEAAGSPWSARSVNGYVEEFLVYSDASKTNLLACSSAAIGTIDIPNSVTSIGNSAFSGCGGLTRVTIPNSVTSIGDHAFGGCGGLTSVTIPNSVTSIGYAAFSSCEGFTSVTVPNSVTSIGGWAFSWCTGLKSVTIGDSIASIEEHAFHGCNNLTSITIPQKLTSLGTGALSGCGKIKTIVWNAKNFPDFAESDTPFYDRSFDYDLRSQITSFIFGDKVESIPAYLCNGMNQLISISIPASVTRIGDYAFYNCIRIPKIEIPNSVTNIGKSAFRKCSGATNITIGSSVVNIEDSAFLDCSRITGNLSIPNSVTNIGTSAFSGCVGLTNIEIGNGVKIIGNGAFLSCTGLTSIEISNSVASIGSSAFDGCSNLAKITCWGTVPASLGNNYSLSSNSELSIYVPCGSLEAYKTAWSPYSSKIKEMLYLEFAINANINMEGAGIVTIPRNICEELSATANYGYHFVKWSDEVTDNPRTIELTQDTTLIAEFAYDRSGNCGNDSLLTWSYNPDKKVLHIDGDGAFVENILCGVEARPNLEKIIIGKGVTAINTNAFTDCPNLTTIEWQAINGGNCAACPFPSSVTSVTFCDGVEHIPARLCTGLTGISSIVIPSSVKTIGNYAFQNINNRKISNLVLPSEIISIGDYAFAGNTYIEQIDFGKSLESIGAYAFQNCSRVITMTCLAEVTPDVGTNALASISDYAELYVLNSALRKYQVDSNWNRFLLKALGATETSSSGEVTVEPGDNTATFTWPTNGDADSYSIEISKDGEVFCTLIFNANGQLTGIAFVPSKDGSRNMPSATMTANGMQFTVTGLNSGTNYAFNLVAKDNQDAVLASYSGNFTTTGESQVPTAIDNPPFPSGEGLGEATKVIKDGRLFILRGDKTYTVTGQEVR